MEIENGLIHLIAGCHDHFTAFKKMEEMVQLMQGASDGVPMGNVKNYKNTLPNSFTATDLVAWLANRVTDRDVAEASHLARMLKRYNFIYSANEFEAGIPQSTNVVSTSMTHQDTICYRFQAPYYWPSINTIPDDADYAIYLMKKTFKKSRKETTDEYEKAALEKLKKTLCDRWDFIVVQSQEQLGLLSEYKEDERQVIAGQERAFWSIHRPASNEVNVMETKRSRTGAVRLRTKLTEEEITKKIDFLKEILNLQRMKFSKVFESLVQRVQVYQEHDPLLVDPHPSNPWLSDDTTMWNDDDGRPELVNERRLRKWAISMRELIRDVRGLVEFRSFLESEFSSENIEFLLAVKDLKKLPSSGIPDTARDIYKCFLDPGSQKEINIDSKTMSLTVKRLERPTRSMFDEAEDHISSLMEKDSYPRFLKSDQYKNLVVTAQTKIDQKKKKFSFGLKKRLAAVTQGKPATVADHEDMREEIKVSADVCHDEWPSCASSITSSSTTLATSGESRCSCNGDKEWSAGRSKHSYSTGNLKDLDSKAEHSSRSVGDKASRTPVGRFSPMKLKKKLQKMVRSTSPLPQNSNLAVPLYAHHHHHHCHCGEEANVTLSAENFCKSVENIRAVSSVPGNLCHVVVLSQK